MHFIKQRSPTRSFFVTNLHSSNCLIATRRYQVILVALILLYFQDIASSFAIPGPHTRPNIPLITKDSHNSIQKNRNYFQRTRNACVASQVVLYSKPKDAINKNGDEDLENQNIPMMNRVGRFGSRVVSSVRRSNDDDKDTVENRDDEDQGDKPKKSWFGGRGGKDNTDVGKAAIKVESGNENTSSAMDFVSNTFKIRKKTKDEDNIVKGSESPTESSPREKDPFGSRNIADPFKSEIALAIELKKEKALDRYMSSGAAQIPEEFLPRARKDGSLGLDKTLATLDDSISFVRAKLSNVRMNKNDESSILFLTPEQEEQRLNKIRKDLEIRRQGVLEQEQFRKKKKDSIDRAKAEKLRMAATRAKREQVERRKNEKKLKTRAQLQKNIASAAKGEEVYNVLIDEIDDDDGDGDDGDEVKILEIQKGRIGAFVDGVFDGASTAMSTAWQTIRTTASKGEEHEWIPVCQKIRISPGEVYPVVAGGLELLVIGSKDGTKVFCVSNTCPHLGTPLETGMVERRPCSKVTGPTKSTGLNTDDDTKVSVDDGSEECIVCPLHKTAFSLDTGEVRGDWCPYPPILGKVMGAVKAQNNLTTFTMRSRGKNLEIKISSTIEDDVEKRK